MSSNAGPDSTTTGASSPEEGESTAQASATKTPSASETLTYAKLHKKVAEWTKKLTKAAEKVSIPGPDNEPFKHIYTAIGEVNQLQKEVEDLLRSPPVTSSPVVTFWVTFAHIHVLSSLAKWNEVVEELSTAQKRHVQCLDLIEKEIQNETTEKSQPEDLLGVLSISPEEKEQWSGSISELRRGRERVRYMYIYELTRYAILCSERDNQGQALELLMKAEVFYHDQRVNESLAPLEPNSLLGLLDSLNPESSKEMFTYVLFYLGQAYKIQGEKERAILYLHMVLRRQLEKGDFNNITWGSDSARMASVLMLNAQAFETARNILVAATTVMNSVPKEEKDTDTFRQNWADLGRTWAKFGVQLLEASCDRLKDLEEQTRPPVKFDRRMKFSKYEKLSLEISDDQQEYDTLLLIRSLNFPTLETTEVEEVEMKGRFVRDFDEARAVFLPAQKWTTIAKEYYNIDEFAGDYIDIATNYASSFKNLAFFEPSIDRRVKMHKKRIAILEELLVPLNPKIYSDVFHYVLRELAEAYETVYKLKVDECKDRGKSLRPKDKKLVQWLTDACKAHKRNLTVFGFDENDPDPTKDFTPDYEKILCACALSVGRILGSVCHDHPLHPDAISLGEESKKFYQFFMDYLDRHRELKEEFRVLYEGSEDMPELLDGQIRKIRHHLRARSNAQSEIT